MLRPAAAALLSGALALTMVSCGPTRSVESYCQVMEKHKNRYLDATGQVSAEDDPLGAGLQWMVAAGDLGSMFDEAATVAPAEIAPDVEQIAEWWDEQEKQSLSDPMGAISAALTGSIYNAAAMSRVEDYTATNCPSVGRMF